MRYNNGNRIKLHTYDKKMMNSLIVLHLEGRIRNLTDVNKDLSEKLNTTNEEGAFWKLSYDRAVECNLFLFVYSIVLTLAIIGYIEYYVIA